jgi:hypothetical protein
MIVEKQMECRLAGETEVLGKNLPQRHFCPRRWLISADNSSRLEVFLYFSCICYLFLFYADQSVFFPLSGSYDFMFRGHAEADVSTLLEFL